MYMKIYRRIKYEDITDLTPAEGRETPYSIQMQIAQVREIQGEKIQVDHDSLWKTCTVPNVAYPFLQLTT